MLWNPELIDNLTEETIKAEIIMKFVLSPSKTKTISLDSTKEKLKDGQFQTHITQEIVKHVQSLDVTALGKALKLKDDQGPSAL